MNGILKGVLIFASGVGCGFGIGTVLWKEKYKSIAEKEVADMKAFYEEETDKIKQAKQRAKDIKKNNKILKKQQYVSYDKMSEEEVLERVKTLQDKSVKEAHPEDDYPESPFVIDEPAYSEDELYFEKIQADYYMDDGALVNENEELLNIDDSIGYENLERFLNSNESVMYIRNAHLATDYEVTKVGGKYSDILGLGGDEEDD